MSSGGSRLRSFLAELRRRHIFRVGVVYAIVAFVVLQVADIAFPALRLPDWTLTFVVVMSILGFPIAMVLAWIFDITTEGVRRTEALADQPDATSPSAVSNRAAAITAAVAMVGITVVAGWLLIANRFEWGLAVAANDRGDRTVLVVLPFENLGQTSEAYFADGITEEITARLASIQRLGIIARTSAIQYKNTDKSVQQIGEELGVDYILEGTVRWEYREDGPDRVRVTPQLIRVSDGTHVWAHIYQEPITSIFDVQTEIADSVMHALDITLLEPERLALASKLTENVEAFEYYLRGNKYSEAGFTQMGGREAVELYRRAIELDPEFEEAAAKLAEAEASFYWANFRQLFGTPDPDYEGSLRRLSLWSIGSDTTSYHIAKAILATRLADSLQAEVQYDSAQRILIRHLSERPTDARVHAQLGLTFAGMGQGEEAIREGKRAVELLPDAAGPSATAAWAENLAHIYVMVGQHDDAIDVIETLLESGSPVSAAWLRVDPTWNAIRDHPRFQQLLEEHG